MEKLTLEEKALISCLLSNRLTYLQREFLNSKKRIEGCTDNKKYFEDIMKADEERINLCFSALSKIRSII